MGARWFGSFWFLTYCYCLGTLPRAGRVFIFSFFYNVQQEVLNGGKENAEGFEEARASQSSRAVWDKHLLGVVGMSAFGWFGFCCFTPWCLTLTSFRPVWCLVETCLSIKTPPILDFFFFFVRFPLSRLRLLPMFRSMTPVIFWPRLIRISVCVFIKLTPANL